MENQTKVNLWTEELLNKCKNNGLVNFNFQNEVNLRMTNYQYDEIFSLLMNGFPLKINELDLTNKTLAQALDDATNEDKQNKKNHIYTADDKNVQREKLKYLLTKDNLMLTFGLLDYFDDKNMNIKSAPLVLMPIKLEYIENNNSYQISNINHELYLNDYLINKLIEERRIDISYPLESNFSLIEYFTYVSTKVRNYHFSVNNGCFITCLLNQESFYQYKDFQLNQKFILDLPIVKSISYLNSEFFNFNKVTSSKLYNQYLSLLNLDNDEYKILKRINQRENIVLRTNLKEIEIEEKEQNKIEITVDDAVPIGFLAQKLLKEEIAGFEEIAGIPGTIGGAILMNAGAHGKEIKDIVTEVTAMDYNGKIFNFTNEEAEFTYRHSKFSNGEYIILQAKMLLQKGSKEEIKAKMDEYAQYRKEKQPIEYPSAGSTFKRGTDFITAKLIDEAGLKGYSIGGAKVSEKHAGFIINTGDATSQDVLDLAKYITDKVYEKFRKKIEFEIRILK